MVSSCKCSYNFTCLHCFENRKPAIWTPASGTEKSAYKVRLQKRFDWLQEQIATRPNAYACTIRYWKRELKNISKELEYIHP